MAVVAAYACLEANGEALLKSSPDVLLLQFGMGRSPEGLHILRTSRQDAKTIVIGVPNTDDDILSCIEGEGAAGYVLMDASIDDLIRNVHAIVNGETLCSPRIASLAFGRVSTLARRSSSMPAQNGACLTRRESEIAKLIDQGLSNKEIAARLYIEVSTVKNHIHNILDKLQLHNRYSAVKYLKDQSASTGQF
jgi:DNA-binding NarL/FixJ family response regulator